MSFFYQKILFHLLWHIAFLRKAPWSCSIEWLMVYRLCYWLFSGNIWMTIAWSLIFAWWSNVAKQRSVFCCRQRFVEASSEILCLRTWRSCCLFRPHLSLRTLLATKMQWFPSDHMQASSVLHCCIPHIWDWIFGISWSNCLDRTCLDHWPGLTTQLATSNAVTLDQLNCIHIHYWHLWYNILYLLVEAVILAWQHAMYQCIITDLW